MDEAKDEFGLPRRVSLFFESDEELLARMTLTEAVIDRFVESVLRQVNGDREIAKRMICKAVVRQTAKRKGSPPKHKRNNDMREQVASRRAQGEMKTGAIHAVAEMVAPPDADGTGYDSAKRQLWRLNRKDQEDAGRVQEARRAWAFLITGDRRVDFDTALAEYHRRLGDSFINEGD